MDIMLTEMVADNNLGKTSSDCFGPGLSADDRISSECLNYSFISPMEEYFQQL